MSGRLIRRLGQIPLAAGEEHRLTWDARDDAGREVSTGLYFVRVQTARSSLSAKVLRLQ